MLQSLPPSHIAESLRGSEESIHPPLGKAFPTPTGLPSSARLLTHLCFLQKHSFYVSTLQTREDLFTKWQDRIGIC